MITASKAQSITGYCIFKNVIIAFIYLAFCNLTHIPSVTQHIRLQNFVRRFNHRYYSFSFVIFKKSKDISTVIL